MRPAQVTNHQPHRKAAAQQWYQHPAPLAENDCQGQQQEDQHTNTEGGQVVLDETDHVGNDHGYAAQVDLGAVTVAVEDVPDPFDGAVPFLALGLGELDECLADGFQSLLFFCRGLAALHFIPQLVALPEQFKIALGSGQIHLYRSGARVFTDQQVGVQWIVEQRFFGGVRSNVVLVNGLDL